MKILLLITVLALAGCCSTFKVLSGDDEVELTAEDLQTLRTLGDKYKVDNIIFFRDYNTEISTGTK